MQSCQEQMISLQSSLNIAISMRDAESISNIREALDKLREEGHNGKDCCRTEQDKSVIQQALLHGSPEVHAGQQLRNGHGRI